MELQRELKRSKIPEQYNNLDLVDILTVYDDFKKGKSSCLYEKRCVQNMTSLKRKAFSPLRKQQIVFKRVEEDIASPSLSNLNSPVKIPVEETKTSGNQGGKPVTLNKKASALFSPINLVRSSKIRNDNIATSFNNYSVQHTLRKDESNLEDQQLYKSFEVEAENKLSSTIGPIQILKLRKQLHQHQQKFISSGAGNHIRERSVQQFQIHGFSNVNGLQMPQIAKKEQVQDQSSSPGPNSLSNTLRVYKGILESPNQNNKYVKMQPLRYYQPNQKPFRHQQQQNLRFQEVSLHFPNKINIENLSKFDLGSQQPSTCSLESNNETPLNLEKSKNYIRYITRKEPNSNRHRGSSLKLMLREQNEVIKALNSSLLTALTSDRMKGLQQFNFKRSFDHRMQMQQINE